MTIPARLPLYTQVRDALVQRLVKGVWAPGQILPSEGALAAELGVSQGTVRKALDAMGTENLVFRRQGIGTFVTGHDEARILFQFFRVTPDSGAADFPESRVLSCTQRAANGTETARLALGEGAQVIDLRRIRLLEGKPAIAETVILPAALFPGFAGENIPNNLYALYATRFGLGIARAQERLKAVLLEAGAAELLGVLPGHPALLIDRLALALDGQTIEWRSSLCITDEFHYSSDLA